MTSICNIINEDDDTINLLTGIQNKNDHYLYINREILFLPTSKQSNGIKVSWNFESPINMIDWIGLYRIEEKNPMFYLSYQQIKSTMALTSSIIFQLTYDKIFTSNTFTTSSFIFRYYDGISGSLRATSPQFCIFSHARLIVNELNINGHLNVKSKKQQTIKSCYAKIYCGDFCYRTLTVDRITNDEEYKWKNLKFLFPVDCSRDLTVEVWKEENFFGKNKIIGIATIPFLDLINSARNRNLVNYTCHLRKQTTFLDQENKYLEEKNKKSSEFVNEEKSNNNNINSINIACLTLTIRITPTVDAYLGEEHNSPEEERNIEIENTLISSSLSRTMNIPTNGQKNNNTPLSYNRKKFINDGNSNNIIEEEEDDKNEGHNKKDIYKSFDYKRNGSPLSGEDNQIELSIYNDSSPSNSYKKNCKKNINTSQSSSISSGVSSLSEASTSSSNKSNCDIALNLPTGFEARVDKNGRIFYIDHINKKTTWTLPIFQEKEAYIDINNRNLHTTDVLINNMDLKYTCTRRTTVKSSNISSSILQPALTFLQRSDFVNVLQTNPEALQIYNSSSYLKHMITRIRKKETTNDDGNKNNMYYYEKFSKNKELINFINLFADKTQPLPYGWQELSTINIHNDSFTKFYANHKTKQITAIDPRLPIEIKKRTRSVPIKKNKFISDDTLTSMTRIYQSIDEIKELVKEHYPESSNRMCKKLNLISKGGEISLLRFANDIDIIQAISLFEEKSKERRDNDNKNNNIKCITNNFGSAFSLFNDSQIHNEEFFEEFKEKVNYFYTSLTRSGYGTGPTKIKLLLRRFFLVEDSFTKILSIDSIQLRKSQFTVSFEDEDGLDYGGPSRELFFLLSRDLFNPYYGLFEYSSPNVYTVTISKNSSKVKNYLKWFELCGRVLGLALMHRCLIDTFFPKPFYKILLGINYIIDDLKDMDQEYYNSLKWISENNITGIIDFNFTASTSINGKITDIDLLPDGSNLKVTEYNKDQYINLLLKHRIERNIQEQIKALLRGLHDVIDSNYLRVFSPSQLSLLLSGTMDIDLEDWRENTEYKSGYFDSHVVINWFWNVVYKLTNAERLKLLKFVTGTSSIPFEGFKGLRGSNGGLKKFTIEKWGDSESLPRAHTCFNRLDLPLYKDQQTIRNKLLIAINESDSYAIE